MGFHMLVKTTATFTCLQTAVRQSLKSDCSVMSKAFCFKPHFLQQKDFLGEDEPEDDVSAFKFDDKRMIAQILEKNCPRLRV